MIRRSLVQRLAVGVTCLALGGFVACSERSVAGPSAVSPDPDRASGNLVTSLLCTVQVADAQVSCGVPSTAADGSVSRDIIGGQNTFVKLTSSAVSYNGGTGLFQFDVTVQNLLVEAIGTADGVTPNVAGIRAFIHSGPVATGGSGVITVLNADSTGTFTATNQPFFRYTQLLVQNAVSTPKTWQFNIPNTVTSFVFSVYLDTPTQTLLVINELMANPGGGITDANGEWVELYNAGTREVNLLNMYVADSGSAWNAYHQISGSVVVPSGGYVVLGRNSNTVANGGVPVDYVMPSTTLFADGVGDAFRISKVFAGDTIVIDNATYTSGAISAKLGISRELKNPNLANTNMDGTNWDDATVGAVYGTGGRGTPKAQNSTFVP